MYTYIACHASSHLTTYRNLFATWRDLFNEVKRPILWHTTTYLLMTYRGLFMIQRGLSFDIQPYNRSLYDIKRCLYVIKRPLYDIKRPIRNMKSPIQQCNKTFLTMQRNLFCDKKPYNRSLCNLRRSETYSTMHRGNRTLYVRHGQPK